MMANMTNTDSHYSLDGSRRIADVVNMTQTGFASQTLVPLDCDGARRRLTHRTSHHHELQAGRRTAKTFRHRPTASGFHNILFAVIIIISSCCSFTAASPRAAVADYPERITDPLASATEERRSAVDLSEPLLVDLRPPPPGVAWHYNYNGEVLDGPEDPYLEDDTYLQKRQDLFGDNSETTSTSSKTHSSTSTSHSSTSISTSTSATHSSVSDKSTATSTQSSSTLASTTDSGILATATADGNTPLPSPFDSSLGNNFTTPACPAFIQSFLANAQFKACLPLSLLLQNSNSFFQAEKSIVRITQVLDATCAATSSTCAPYLSSLAANLTSAANCQADYEAQNPTVVQAHTGLLAYLPLYSASCLKNPKTNAYCFADAITNASSPTDSYVYFLPLNMSLPASSQPTCNSCLQNTMAVFNSAASNRSQAIADTYNSAAGQINVQCGPAFVQASIPAPTSGGSISMQGNMGLAALVMCLMAWFI